MPRKIVEMIDSLIQQGYFKNRSEALIDAARHFVVSMNPPSEIGSFVRDWLRKRVPRRKVNKEELDYLWRKVQASTEWQERYGKTPEEVMATLRGRE